MSGLVSYLVIRLVASCTLIDRRCPLYFFSLHHATYRANLSEVT